MDGERFDAQRHLTKISGRDYLEVKWRLVWLRAEQPGASIVTELLRDDGASATFKATVTLPDGASATGHGQETSQDFGDYLEKAETKALGRALGALGYGTQFAQDFDLAPEQGQVADSPVQPARVVGTTSPAPRGAVNGDLVTERQLKAIYAIGRSLGLTEHEIELMAHKEHGAKPSELTRRDASTFIDHIKTLQPEQTAQ